MKYYIDYWKKAFNFEDNATRKEYWVPTLINLAIYFILFMISIITYGSSGEAPMSTFLVILLIFAIINIIPSLSILIRRFHDTGRTMLMPLLYILVTALCGGISAGLAGNHFERIPSTITFIFEIYIFIITLLPTNRLPKEQRKNI